ncbi:MAG: hypothetical protein LBG26_07815, partial [Treponema sp.]|nr:hypothetical protein [Treponema sp.]
RSRKSRKCFYFKALFLTPLFDFFDLAVHFFFKYSGFKGILASKKVNAGALRLDRVQVDDWLNFEYY